MFKKKAFLTIYRGLLRLSRQVGPEDTLIIRKPVDTEAFRRAPYSWSETADEICRNTLKSVSPFSTEVPGQFTRATLVAIIRDSFKSSINAAQEDQAMLQDKSLQALRTLGEQVAMMQCSSSTTTRGINVDVTTAHVGEGSGTHVFTYRCRIENCGQQKVQLLGRHWQFRNAENAVVQEVPKGSPGVVGNTPIITPGSCFEYCSAAQLDTPSGSIQGSFQMMNIDTEGNHFDAQVERTPFIATTD
ncbi:hypothetical protein WJX74_008921 [Apatococcus lobatus]|uniref:ApaG domain-containing protein n=2 Tax=Apatococcus TaxID=904362 RepID=A0AAW1SR69_9CHLO